MNFSNKGERFDILLTANKLVKNYWIRVKGFGCKLLKIIFNV